MALIIRTNFLSNASKENVWGVITDIEKAAPCFPGAILGDKIQENQYHGSFEVRLGPMTFHFKGKFGFVEKDEDLYHAQIQASGTDTKGRGSAQGIINVNLQDQDGKTNVEIISDVNLSGAVAQYGRGAGMIQAISQQLINEFAKNLEKIIPLKMHDPNSNSQSYSHKEQYHQDTNIKMSKPQTVIKIERLVWQSFLSWIKGMFSK